MTKWVWLKLAWGGCMAEPVNMKTQQHTPLSPPRRWKVLQISCRGENLSGSSGMLEIFHLPRKLLPMNTPQSGHGESLASFVKRTRWRSILGKQLY